MNMPTRADMVALGERLQSIEDQLARLTATIDRAAPSGAKTYDGPPRTKKPAAHVNGPVPAAVEMHMAAADAVAAPVAKPVRRAARKKSKAS
jgi:hypothetical protein